MHRFHAPVALLWVVLLTSVACRAEAALLPAKEWEARDSFGARVEGISDGKLETVWTSAGPQRPGLAIEVDLRKEALVHRIFLTPGEKTASFPRSLRLFLSREPTPAFVPAWQRSEGQRESTVIEYASLGQAETSLRFNPVRARYLRLEIGPETSGLPWSLAELEVRGTTDTGAFKKSDAVLLAEDAPAPLRLAAEELRYYVSELSGRPIPIVPPEQAALYPGTLYRIADLKPLASTYEEMLKNSRAGKLPEGVNVERVGREVTFRAWPYRNVLWSVYEFLEHQGVRWVYPDAHGDSVPEGKGVRLDLLPLRYTPSASRRYANFGMAEWQKEPLPEAYLYWLRCRWESSWNAPAGLGGEEIPKADPARVPQTRLGGYPHSFSEVVPEEVLEKHPEWCGMYTQPKWAERIGKEKLGKRLPPGQGGPATFCMSNTEVADYVAQRVIALAKGNPAAEGQVSLMPMDAASFCECERCARMDGPYEPEPVAFAMGGRGLPIVSESYYFFVAQVARRLEKALPKVKVLALAYASYHRAPRKLAELPDNVVVDICQYGARNLPMESPRNQAMRERLAEWSRQCRSLRNYDYVLIHSEGREMKLPVPLVGAIVSRAHLLRKVGALDGGSQASFNALPYCPWNYYAYSRLLWNADTTEERVLDDFFPAYFREAAEPMLRFYRLFEEHVVKNDIDLDLPGYDYGPVPGSLTPALAAALDEQLKQAEGLAHSWVVARRVRSIREGFSWSAAKLGIAGYGGDVGVAAKRSYPCQRLPGKIRVDGVLDDAAWKGVPVSRGFFVGGQPTYAITRQSEVRLAWDDQALYLAVRCREPDVAKINPLNGKHPNGVYGEDSVEVFLAPGLGDPTVYYRLAIASNGFLEGPDRYTGSMSNRETLARSGVETAGTAGPDFWSVEARIPFAVLGKKPAAGAEWLANVSRNVRVASGTGEEATTWSCMLKPNWHNYHEYSAVRFADAALSPEDAAKLEAGLNAAFDTRYPVQAQKRRTQQEVLASLGGAQDLCTLEAMEGGKARPLMTMGDYPDFVKDWAGMVPLRQPPVPLFVRWARPVRLDTLLIRWAGLDRLSRAYSIEAWEGDHYRLLADEHDNDQATAIYRFEPVTTSRLRITLYAPAPVQAIEAYDLGAARK